MKSYWQLKKHLHETLFEETVIEYDLDGKSEEEIVAFLKKMGIDYHIDEDGMIYIEDEDVDGEDQKSESLEEGSAVRKVVIRKGRKKIVFKCKPGQKKIGARTCKVRKSSDLAKMKRRAKRSARKSRSKRSAATRKRKRSNIRRKTMGLNKKKR